MLKKVTKFSLIFIIFSLSFGVVIVSDDDVIGSIVVKKISGWQYFATDQLARLAGGSRDFDPLAMKETITFLGAKITFSIDNPFILIDGRAYNMGLPTRLEGDGLMVPLIGFFECFAMATSRQMTISSDTIRLKTLAKKVGDLRGLLAQRRAAAIRSVYKAQPIPEKLEKEEIRKPIKPGKSKVIVIDPGHGGKDPGAIGPSGVKEKDITLSIARRLKKILEKRGYTVILTRNGDVFVPLARRTEMANKVGASMFISIHCNASRKKDSHGVQVFYLSPARTDDARAAAALENKALLLEDNPVVKDLSELAYIMTDMVQSEYQRESSLLAYLLEQKLSRETGFEARGPEGAGFYVLYGAFMPAVLVETAFITNPNEEKKLKTNSYQEKIAKAVADGVEEFMKNIEKTR